MADNGYQNTDIDYGAFYRSLLPPVNKYGWTGSSYGMLGARSARDVAADYAPSGGLSSVSRPTVPINPNTGMPYATTANATVKYGGGIGAGGGGSLNYTAPRQFQANPNIPGIRDLGIPQYGTPGKGGGVLTPAGYPPNATTDKRYDQRLAPQLPALTGAYGKLGAAGRGSGSLTASMPNRGGTVHQLNVDPPDEEGQFYADSMRMPVRTKSGKVYTPSGGAQSPQQRSAAKSAPAQQQRGLGGLLGSLFGSGGNGGGLFGGMLGQRGSAARTVPGIGGFLGPSAPPVNNIVGGPATYSNGVENPSYRDYGSTTPGNGTFTDSLGGVYHDRNLR